MTLLLLIKQTWLLIAIILTGETNIDDINHALLRLIQRLQSYPRRRHIAHLAES